MTGIEHLIGGPGPDTLIGSEGDDILEGGEGGDVITGLGGNDVLDGGGQFGDGGYDEVHFDDAPGPVTIDVGAGTAIGDGSDAISGFEVVQGSGFDDRFIGAPGLDGFYGLDGADTIDYRTSSKGVKADLSVGVGGTEHGDFFDSVERAIGTHFADILHGSSADNELIGLAGPDDLFGRGGADILRGGAGSDALDGGPGIDSCFGGPGHDSVLRCEV
jgi:Ca2+-binding RTX toxin-like protein